MPSADAPFLPDADELRLHAGDAVRLLKALANEKRLMILCMLVGGERSVGELNAQLDLSQSALSQHLAVLREDGLVTTRREAQTIHYTLADGAARRILETLHAVYCAGEQPICEPPPRDATPTR